MCDPGQNQKQQINSRKLHRYICSNNNNTLYGSKLSIFIYTKTIRILSKDHVPWNICRFRYRKLYQILISNMQTKDPNLVNFLNIRFFCTLRFQKFNSCILAKYCPIYKSSIEIFFIQLSAMYTSQ